VCPRRPCACVHAVNWTTSRGMHRIPDTGANRRCMRGRRMPERTCRDCGAGLLGSPSLSAGCGMAGSRAANCTFWLAPLDPLRRTRRFAPIDCKNLTSV
jgi:hypothetical protein